MVFLLIKQKQPLFAIRQRVDPPNASCRLYWMATARSTREEENSCLAAYGLGGGLSHLALLPWLGLKASFLRYASGLAFSIIDAITNPQSHWTGSIRGVLWVLELWGWAVNFEAWFSCREPNHRLFLSPE